MPLTCCAVQAPSAIKFAESYPLPQEMTLEKIQELKQAFLDAAERCKKAGYDWIEIHGAHGYLIHSELDRRDRESFADSKVDFVSPLSNHRTDQYGGSLENRLRLPLEIATALRQVWDKPLFYRVSATDWFEGAERSDDAQDASNDGWRFWGIEQTTILAQKLRDLGVDLIDVSSGGNYVGQKIPVGPSYQVPFAAHLKQHVPGVLIGAVGLITDAKQAEDILQQGEADVIFLARELLRNPDFVLEAAQELGVSVQAPVQYERAWTRMLKPKHQ